MSSTPVVEDANDFVSLVSDLGDEQCSLDEVVRDLSDEQWRRPTPSAGWNVRDQICHLAYFDARGALAIRNPDAFGESTKELLSHALHEGVDEYTLGPLRQLAPDELVRTWRDARASLLLASAALESTTRVAWYGPSMSARSFLSARLMETWAHGVDVVAALGVTREPTSRLRHVAHLGYVTRNWSYQVRGEPVPESSVRVELDGPQGERWTWGPSQCDDVIRASAYEFCLVVTQRRHLDDTSLRCGALGREWMLRAQAFAGAPSTGPHARASS